MANHASQTQNERPSGPQKAISPPTPPPVVELGYLTTEGCLVVADSLGRRILFKAYRMRELESYVEVLGFRRPLEKVADARIQVRLHREGWAKPGEVLLRDSPCRLYRTRTRHYAFGPDWESLTRRDWIADPIVYSPWYSAGSAKGSPARPRPGSPFVVSFSDLAVKGCRRAGATVDLYGVELKEFTDFVLGKLRVSLRFESEGTAEAFARQFPAVSDLAALDAAVKVEIDRSRKVGRPRRKPGSPKARRKLSRVRQRQVALWAVIIAVEAATVAAFALPPFDLFVIPVTVLAAASVVWRDHRVRDRVERLDLAAKFPGAVWTRFAAQAPAHAAGFAYMLRDRGVELRPDVVDLEPVDALLRDLPADTRFGAVILGAGALVGQAFLAAVGRKVASAWVWQPKERIMVLQVRNAYWVSPLTWVGKVWSLKPKETLQDFVDVWTAKVRSALAYGHRVTFFATGFAPGFAIPEALVERVARDAERVPPESFVLGDRHVRRRRVPYGPFSIDLVEGEILERGGPAFMPLLALPFAAGSVELRATLDGASPHVPNTEDTAVVRLAGAPMLPLGVQIRNFVEVGPTFGSPEGDVVLRFLAVSDKVDLLAPRMRETRPEVKDFLVPMSPREDGVPTSSYATLLGRIERVEEVTNPVTSTDLWRLRVDVSGVTLAVSSGRTGARPFPRRGASPAGTCGSWPTW